MKAATVVGASHPDVPDARVRPKAKLTRNPG